MTHAFVDALVARPDLDADDPIARRIMINVDRLTRQKRPRKRG